MSLLVASSPTLAKLLGAAIVTAGVAALAVAAALALDIGVAVFHWLGRRPPRGLRMTRPTLEIVLLPLVLVSGLGECSLARPMLGR